MDIHLLCVFVSSTEAAETTPPKLPGFYMGCTHTQSLLSVSFSAQFLSFESVSKLRFLVWQEVVSLEYTGAGFVELVNGRSRLQLVHGKSRLQKILQGLGMMRFYGSLWKMPRLQDHSQKVSKVVPTSKILQESREAKKVAFNEEPTSKEPHIPPQDENADTCRTRPWASRNPCDTFTTLLAKPVFQFLWGQAVS